VGVSLPRPDIVLWSPEEKHEPSDGPKSGKNICKVHGNPKSHNRDVCDLAPIFGVGIDSFTLRKARLTDKDLSEIVVL
jgi:hypothetical protein